MQGERGPPEAKACRQFFAPGGDWDVPPGFAKNGDTIVLYFRDPVFAERVRLPVPDTTPRRIARPPVKAFAL